MDTKFKYNDRVKIKAGFYRGLAGTVLTRLEVKSNFWKKVIGVDYFVALDKLSEYRYIPEENLELELI